MSYINTCAITVTMITYIHTEVLDIFTQTPLMRLYAR